MKNRLNIARFKREWGSNKLIEKLDEETKFGIEIECVSKKKLIYDRYESVTNKIGRVNKWFSDTHIPRLVVMDDGSLPWVTGFEVVLGPYQGWDGISYIMEVCDILKDKHVKTNVRSAGGHTNVSTPSFHGNLSNMYVFAWNARDSKYLRSRLKGARSHHNRYCKKGAGHSCVKEFGMEVRPAYLEFRLWNSTLDWREWASRIVFGQEFIKFANERAGLR